jgi:hypothetical protein
MRDVKQAWVSLNDWLKSNGFTVDASARGCTHRQGIPDVDAIAVKPIPPVEGDAVVLVTLTTLSLYKVAEPVEENMWKRVRHGKYANPFELQDQLEEETQEALGCWAEEEV